MKEFIYLREKFNKMKEMDLEIKSSNLNDFVGKMVRINENYSNWVNIFGYKAGLSYEHVELMKTHPQALVLQVNYYDLINGFCFHLDVEGLDEKLILGINEIDIVENKNES